MIKADLHVHSNYSDGSDSIEELVKKIESSGINIFALTDHDTIDGCLKIQKILPKNIKFIPAIELTCKTEPIKCHILGYNCDIYSNNLSQLINKGKKLRKIKLDKRIEFLNNKWGIKLTQEELNWLYSRTSPVKTHFANILVNRNLATDNVSAMKKYFEGCKTGNTKFSIEEGIKTILSSGGIPVWAHPLGGEGEVHIQKDEFLRKLDTMLDLGIQGLECYYSRYSIDEIEFLVEIGEKNNLLITGGSDYHGSNKDIPLGKLNTINIPIDIKKLTILNKIQ